MSEKINEFITISGGPTKPEIIAIALSKLNLKEKEVFVDIGCGTGAVTIAASNSTNNLTIYGIDARDSAIQISSKNFKNFNVKNITLFHGEASIVLNKEKCLEKINCAFIGGTKNIDSVISILYEKKVQKIVVNAVRIEMVVRVINIMKKLNIFKEVVHVALSRSSDLRGETMFKPENPVYIIVGTQEMKEKKC